MLLTDIPPAPIIKFRTLNVEIAVIDTCSRSSLGRGFSHVAVILDMRLP